MSKRSTHTLTSSNVVDLSACDPLKFFLGDNNPPITLQDMKDHFSYGRTLEIHYSNGKIIRRYKTSREAALASRVIDFALCAKNQSGLHFCFRTAVPAEQPVPTDQSDVGAET